MPTYESPKRHLKSAIESVVAQTYEHWELWICDDGSSDDTPKFLREVAKLDARIKILALQNNSGISAATNAILERASGEYIAMLDHDDMLTKNALSEIVSALNIDRSTDVVYTDQDKIDGLDIKSEPFFKPDWSPRYFRGAMYVGHLLVVRKSLALEVGGFDSRYDKVQDYEFMLRLCERTGNIKHIPMVLYHWRMIEGSVAHGADEKGDIDNLQVDAVNAHLCRLGVNAEAARHGRYRHRTKRTPLPRQDHPKISVVIPTKDAPEHIERCLASMFSKTTYENYEVIVVDNATTDEQALRTLKRYPAKVVPFNENFNYSKANNIGVAASCGDVVVLLNNDTEVITPNWLEILLSYLDESDVTVVGPVLTYPDDSVQHAGVVLGFRGTADHVMRGFPRDSDGYAGSLSCAREVSAVTGACLMISRKDYDKCGGLNEYYATHYQDVELCLEASSNGQRVLCVPDAVLVHHESVSRNSFYDLVDRAVLLDRWGSRIRAGDPFYSPHFSLDHVDYSLIGST